MIRVVQVTDLHVEPEDREADRILPELAETIEGLRPDLVLVTGDVAGHHRVPYRLNPSVRRKLEPFLVRLATSAPVVVVMGNHDHEASLERWTDLGGAFGVDFVPGAMARRYETPHGAVDVYALAYPRRGFLAREADATGASLDADVSAALEGLIVQFQGDIVDTRSADRPAAVIGAGHWMAAGGRTSGGEIIRPREPTVSLPALDAFEVDFGVLGHLHAAQDATARWGYGGSAWPIDFGDTVPKSFQVIDVGRRDDGDDRDDPFVLEDPTVFAETPTRRQVTRWRVPTGALDVVTLDWRWGEVEAGRVGWVLQPSETDLARARGARVRARLSVSEAHSTSAPWAEVLAELSGVSADVFSPPRRIETSQRRQAVGASHALTHEERLRAWAADQAIEIPAAALDDAAAVLAELIADDDDEIDARTRDVSRGGEA